MRAEFRVSTAAGTVTAPPSKSMAHRMLVCAGLSGGPCTVSGISDSQDMLATMNCLQALGVTCTRQGDKVTLQGGDLFTAPKEVVSCGESGSTLRFFVPLFLLGRQKVTLTGEGRLMERPMGVYQTLCRERSLLFYPDGNKLYLRGPLQPGLYTVPGDVSSQFISGLLFALPLLEAGSVLSLVPPVESRPYIEMTRQAQALFGVSSVWTDEYTLRIPGGQCYCPVDTVVEGDWSNAAFLDGFSLLGGRVTTNGLIENSLQGDKIYKEYYKLLQKGCPTLDIQQCPDLGPVLMALAAACNGAVLTGTRRLAMKESDRGAAMAEELAKLGVQCVVEEDTITIPAGQLQPPAVPLNGHNDHRVVMALSLLLSRLGGSIQGAQAVRKSFPDFFAAIRSLGIEVELHEDL
ncbi:MAG: 3-phosphoshikimate 1-carboxyvinyltransferase [Clostridia bacterium]|nr:3-phosphoshikimate 1-carboxyvinyltransferase [Clostridia bacterium]